MYVCKEYMFNNAFTIFTNKYSVVFFTLNIWNNDKVDKLVESKRVGTRGSEGNDAKYIEPKQIFAAVHEAVTNTKFQEIINLESNKVAETHNNWELVNRRRGRARKGRKHGDSAIVGTSELSGKLKSVPKTVSLYVTRLSPETSAADVGAQLMSRFPEIKAVEMPSKFPEIYKSFKVTLNRDNYEAVMAPEIWPAGVRVDRFFYRREQKNRPM